MTSERRWTYADITAEVVRQIRRAMTDADATQLEITRAMNRDWAMGAYLVWIGLTEGSHHADDVLRLKALARPAPDAGNAGTSRHVVAVTGEPKQSVRSDSVEWSGPRRHEFRLRGRR
ncbi:hypothetical protein B0G69_7867 [Paraburkholderia sp. RAU2J]|uniref:hypothetical protein n=1 Tax=Paraburkholderia sp. RAU2J TaxID=1938810 RepID=UPI000EB24621|nr:hypothetical protein [Paraburkholderia sp. RAU2J]RKT10461.1 hypothetical protein B0G69_7867 [Paraburkholderia sp. RAU2J]